KATLAAEAAAFRASGRSAPFFDELVFRPAPTAIGSTWTLSEHSRLTSALATSFAGTAQPSAPPVLIDGVSVETLIPPAKAGSYIAPPGGGVAESEQAAAYLQALEGAACKANASGVLLERLVDGPGPGEQAGLLYADGTPKASAAPVAKAFESAARGTLCRGRAEPSPAPVPTPAPAPAPSAAPAPVPAAGELVFPAALRRSSAPSVRVGCILDCLYLVTLDRADGKPMLARRGALEGGAKTTAVRLPKLPLPAGSYTLSVRIVAQANPGPIELTTSPPLALG
ncbi:MAG TPA: hypothetical protein VH721_10080, partial [Gaiellaceae bacterium]